MKLPDLTKRENLSSAMQLVIMLTVLSLGVPAILIMMTSFTRIVIVMGLLRCRPWALSNFRPTRFSSGFPSS